MWLLKTIVLSIMLTIALNMGLAWWRNRRR